MNTPFKTCNHCGLSKEITEFHKRKSASDGYSPCCKACKSQRAKESYKRNKEHILEYARQYRTQNPEKVSKIKRQCRLNKIDEYKRKERQHYNKNRDKILEYEKAYRIAHPEQIKAYRKKYNQEQREKINASVRSNYRKNPSVFRKRSLKWIVKNRDAMRAAYQRRRARKRNAAGSHTTEDIKRQYKAQKGRCYWCDKKVGKKYHVDHVIPLARGGSNGPENLVVACAFCNDSKGAKLPHEWHGNGGKLL